MSYVKQKVHQEVINHLQKELRELRGQRFRNTHAIKQLAAAQKEIKEKEKVLWNLIREFKEKNSGQSDSKKNIM